jgi:glyoxylate utilization-related uncharacterized protein
MLKLLTDNEKGKTYQADNLKIYYRNRNTISGNNSENIEELIYLISGEIEFTLKDKIEKISGPAEIRIPAKTFHKILALSDIVFIIL